MKHFKNNRRNRYRSNGDKHFKRNENGHKLGAEFNSNSSFRRKNPGRNNQNASKLIEKYTDLAKEALSNGDKILSENYFQHADHFARILEEKDKLKKEENNNINNKEQVLDQSNKSPVEIKTTEN